MGKLFNWFMYGFDYKIRLHITDNVPRKKVPAIKDQIKKLHILWQDLCTKILEAQENATKYYNRAHVLKQF